MTAMDDALNSSSVMFDAPDIRIGWAELNAEQDGVENVSEMSDVLSGEYTVVHSFDDALPDPVTMTGSNDASGRMAATLLGRDGNTYASWTESALSNEVGLVSTTFLATTLPAFGWGDTLLMAISMPSTSAVLTQGEYEGTKYAWDFVGKQTSATMTLWLFTKRAYTGMPAPMFYSTVPVTAPTYACVALGARGPSGRELRWRIRQFLPTMTPGASTTHNQPNATSTTRRSVFLGFWAAQGPASWTVGGGDTSLAGWWSATSAIVVGRAGLYDGQVNRTLTATRSSSTGDVAMMLLVMEPFERPSMQPVEFWSPFNEDSPVYGLERDTGTVELDVNTVTAAGVVPTTVFTGQMDDITVGQDNDVTLEASSKTRITLNKSLNLPLIFARREGGSIDFLVAWILARADRFIGPAPGPYARWWVPCYGSIHAALDAPWGFNYAMYWDDQGASAWGVQYPEFVEGPFHTAVWACHRQDRTQEIVLQPIELFRANEVWPWVSENYFPGQYLQDLFSLTNAAGRLTFWLRGDATYAGTPAGVPSGNRYLFSFLHEINNKDGVLLGRVWLFMEPDRQMYVQMGNTAGGTTTLTWGGSMTLPTDNAWHQYSFSWDFIAGSARLMRNGTTVSSTTWATNGDNNTSGWFETDQALYNSGGRITTYLRSHLPISDIILEAGPEVHGDWDDVFPEYPWPSFTVTARPTMQAIETVPDDAPVNAWDTLAELAQATVSMYRANEFDSMEFLPPQYFAESAQQDVSYVTDTETNAQELDIVADSSKSRNAVTVKFVDTAVDLNYSTALAVTSAVPIGPGTSEIVFTLDNAVAEIHGASDPYSSTWTLTNLNSSQISSGTGAAYDKHYMAVNSMPDGSGTILSLLSVVARIMSYTQTTVTVRFFNKTGKTVYLANNYQGDNTLPSLRILGYLIRSAEGYVTERDGGSIGLRRERSLETEVGWIHDRWTAQQHASRLVSRLARPRHEVTVEVMGDPRRVPGQLVTLTDAASTRASGNWRVLGMAHNADGPAFTQTLRLMKVYPVAVWDESDWDLSVWGE